MPTTIIIKCPKCGNLLLANVTTKTRVCPYCGAKVNLEKAQKIASADNAFEASKMIKKLKSDTDFG